MYCAATFAIQRAPAKAKRGDQIGHADIANEVGIEWASVWDTCREIPVPRERGEKHPGAVKEAYKEEDDVEDFKYQRGPTLSPRNLRFVQSVLRF